MRACGKPAVFIYDGCSGGVGLTRKGFARIEELMAQTLTAVRDCPCDIGCPSCVHSPKCGSGNRPIDKKSCLALLTGLLRKGGRRPAARPCNQGGLGPPAATAGRRLHPAGTLRGL